MLLNGTICYRYFSVPMPDASRLPQTEYIRGRTLTRIEIHTSSFALALSHTHPEMKHFDHSPPPMKTDNEQENKEEEDKLKGEKVRQLSLILLFEYFAILPSQAAQMFTKPGRRHWKWMLDGWRKTGIHFALKDISKFVEICL